MARRRMLFRENNMLNTFLTRQWGLRYPLIGAPMANIARGRLAHAVTAAGGLGMFGVGPKDNVEFIAKEASIARGEGTPARFGIGLMAWLLETRPEQFDAAVREKPFLMSISFGSLRPYADRLKQAGILLATQVNTRRMAIEAAESGADLIVAQGTEAGGHTGAVGTLPLLQALLHREALPRFWPLGRRAPGWERRCSCARRAIPPRAHGPG